MKRLFSLIAIMLCLVGFTAQAQVKFPAGNATQRTITVAQDTSINIAPVNTVEFATIKDSLDTAAVYTIDITKARAGYLLYSEFVVSSADTVSVSFGAGIKGAAIEALPAKKYIIYAVYNGTEYILLGYKQEDE